MCGSVFSENRILTNMEMYLKVTEHEKAMFMLGYIVVMFHRPWG